MSSKGNVVVYRVIGDNGDEQNFSYRTVMSLIELGIVKHRADLYEVIRSDNTTVTIYYHDKV